MTDTTTNEKVAPMLDLALLAETLRISRRHLDDVRREDPTFPAPRMLGKLPRWTYETIHNWAEEAAQQPQPTPIAPRATAARKKGAARVH